MAWQGVRWRKYGLLLASVATIVLTYRYAVRNVRWGGWDYDVYCAANQVTRRNGNPYLVSDIQPITETPFSYNYPPITIPLWQPICSLGDAGYIPIWSVCIIGTVLVVLYLPVERVEHDFWWLLTILFTGFITTFWNFLTGNIGLVELALFAGVIYSLYSGRILLAAGVLGLLSAVRLYPIAFAGLFILRRGGWRRKLAPLVVLTGTILVFHLASWIAFPRLTPWYYLALFGGIEGAPSSEFIVSNMSGINHPSPLLLFQAIAANELGMDLTVGIVLYAIFALTVSVGMFLYLRKRDLPFPTKFAIGSIAVVTILPWLKPYSFTYALVPIYLLTITSDVPSKIAVLLVGCLYPLGSNFLLEQRGHWLQQLGEPILLDTILNFSQLLGLIAILGYVVYTDQRIAREQALIHDYSD